jgi:hypothetical protein
LGRNASMRAVKAGTALRNKLYQRRNGVMFRVCLAQLVLSGLFILIFKEDNPFNSILSFMPFSFLFL